VFEFWSLDNSSSKSILDVLETIYLKFRKPIVKRVTVVKFGVYNGGGNCLVDTNLPSLGGLKAKSIYRHCSQCAAHDQSCVSQ